MNAQITEHYDQVNGIEYSEDKKIYMAIEYSEEKKYIYQGEWAFSLLYLHYLIMYVKDDG